MSIEHLSPTQARARQAAGAVLVDVRQAHERASGQAEGALCISYAELQADPAAHLPERTQEIVLICQMGSRSLTVARMLAAAGYQHLASVQGGTARWIDEGLPLVKPVPEVESTDFLDRYSRQLLLPQVGQAGQQRLHTSRVLLIGAGGLGSPAAYYLAAAGVGTLRIVDDDTVERSNLQRQILHTEARIGTSKVESAAIALAALNPEARIEAIAERLSVDNVERLMEEVDVVIDGADNFSTRYLLNDACVRLGKPLVYGAVQQFEGQVSVFDAGRRRGLVPCYRCLFPQMPPPDLAPDCTQAGVLGVLPGVIGLLQATETIKLLLGIGQSLAGRLLSIDALSMRFTEMRLPADANCPVCGPGVASTASEDDHVLRTRSYR